MDNKYALQIQNVTKCFGGITASNNISFQVPEKALYGVIGPNGAGKTTLFNMITGVYAPTSGEILYYGNSIVGKSTYEIANMGIKRTFQNIRLFNDLSVFDNVLTACQNDISYNLLDGLLRTKRCREQEAISKKRCLEVLEQVGLEQYASQRAGNLPYGSQRRLEIARALVTSPQILLLDEPTTFLDIAYQIEILDMLTDLNRKHKTTIVMVLHDINLSARYADYLFAMKKGRLVAEGTPDEIITPELMEKVYGLACDVITDPVSQSPMVLPKGRHYASAAI